MSEPARTPAPPYYAVVFTSVRSAADAAGYADMAARMEELAARQPGFLGVESARDADGLGITVSYWSSLEAIAAWGRVVEHRAAQQLGRQRWYDAFRLRVCRVESERVFEREN
jgi:heme-degrading monooxygenase HmoA